MQELSTEKVIALASKYGDSFYILDSDVFEENCIKLLAAFRKYYPKTNIAYSYKTNYIPRLGQVVDCLDGFAEVVSEMELEIAQRIGIKPNRIVWNGPVKSRKAMEAFLLSGGTVNVDNREEFSTICDIAEKHGDKRINLGIRCNYDIGDGVLSRFGIDTESDDFSEILKTIAASNQLHLQNLQAHFAKRHFRYWSAKAQGLLDVYEKVISEFGIMPPCLDLGGGLSGSMPAALRDQLELEPFSFEDYASRAAKLFAAHFDNKIQKPWLFIEPGTAVAADCMRYVCRVKSIRTIRGKTIITTNGSQKNISMAGLNPPMKVLTASPRKITCTNADIAGYTCIESDYLYRNFSGEIGVGDYLVIENCGSYSVVMKPPFIFPNVPVIELSAGTAEEIKRAEQFEDLFSTYSI